MNPANRKSPLDNAKFRENYLANLKLQATNNQKNQNANLIFKQTGSPPPFLPDNRTSTDKLADIEGLKVLLRGKLSSVTDGNIASQIVGSLNEDQIQFAMNTWPTIETDMKSKFSLGVPAPIFIAYLNRLMATYEQNDFVDLGLQQSSTLSTSPNQVLYTLQRGDLLRTLVRYLETGGSQFSVNTKRAIDQIKIQMFDYTEFKSRYETLDEREKRALNANLTNLISTIVPDSYIPQLIHNLELTIRKNDGRAFIREVEEIMGMFELTDEQREWLAQIIRIIRARRITEGEETEELPAQSIEEEFERELERRQPEEISVPTPSPLPTGQYMPIEQFERLNGKAQRDYLNQVFTQNPELTVRFVTKTGTVQYRSAKNPMPPTVWAKPENERLYRDLLMAIGDTIPTPQEAEEREGGGGGGETGQVEGEGLHRKKSKMRGRGIGPTDIPQKRGIAHLAEKEYEKPKMYSQFGRYFINKPKLIHSGIMALRLPSGNVVPNFPTQKVSIALKEVLKHLVNGSQPTYEAVSKMSDEDRDKLVDICRTCHIDMPSIPKSKKMDKDEQDDYRFEVLRGEIMAGNNSPVLVKEFKSLLLKFSRNGKVPRGEAHEILEELVAMGL